jgi:hypothetical protein
MRWSTATNGKISVQVKKKTKGRKENGDGPSQSRAPDLEDEGRIAIPG